MCVMSMHVCRYLCVCTCMCACTFAHVCGDPKLTLGVFLSCSSLYFLRQGLSLKPELRISAILASQPTPGTSSVFLLSVGMIGCYCACLAFYLGSGLGGYKFWSSRLACKWFIHQATPNLILLFIFLKEHLIKVCYSLIL